MRYLLVPMVCAAIASGEPAIDVITPYLSPLAVRVAMESRNPQEPQMLAEVIDSIRDVFGVPISIEDFPKESPYAGTYRQQVPPFPIAEGEPFETVIERLLETSGHCYAFEQLRGVFVLRPNRDKVFENNLLDRVVSLAIEEKSVWDALCVLARAINRDLLADGGKPLLIWLDGPDFDKLPAPAFFEKPAVSVKLADVSAREALCAIFASAGSPFSYHYHDHHSVSDDVSVIAYDASGEVTRGQPMRDAAVRISWNYHAIEDFQIGPEEGTPLRERWAKRPLSPKGPRTLSQIRGFIRDIFGVAFSVEPFPKDSEYADISDREVAAFPIDAGETFSSVMARFEAASEYRYKFEMIRGTPVLRPKSNKVEETNLLDTIVDLKLEYHTVWEALCALAQAVNQKRVPDGGKRLHIYLADPSFARLPAPVLVDEPIVSVNLAYVSAREAMCAIFESADVKFNYFYFTYLGDHDYASVSTIDTSGKVIHGARVRDAKELDYWNIDNVARLQFSDE
jgi:hypothetical protein